MAAVYYNASGKPFGYMVYLIKGDVMYVKEMIYLNREAQKGLWEYIHAHESMIDEVRGNTYFNEPVAFDMEDGAIKETIRPYIMGRIIDIEEFLADYRCRPASRETCISFDIADPVLHWNNRTFNILFSDGKCAVTNQTAKYHVRMSVGTLTTLLLGYKTAGQLHWMERIEGDKESIECLDTVIMHETPCISDYI